MPPYSLFSTGQPEHLDKIYVSQLMSLICSNRAKASHLYSQQSQRPYTGSCGPAGVRAFLTLCPHLYHSPSSGPPLPNRLRAHSHPSESLYLKFSPFRTLFPHAWHAPSLPSESNVTFSRRPFLIRLFKIAILPPQACHSFTLLYLWGFITSRHAIYSLVYYLSLSIKMEINFMRAETCLFCSSLYLLCLQQCLTYSKCSGNIGWTN